MACVVDDRVEERTSFVVAELQKVAVMIDEFWRDALQARLSDTEIPLCEASQAVHRAVIALSSLRSAESTAETFAVEWGIGPAVLSPHTAEVLGS
jgi:hypothetical protein